MSKRGLPPRQKMRHDRHYVDELALRSGEGIGRMVSTQAISSNQDQPRGVLGDLGDLVSSIKRHGILEPLLVRAKKDHRYELVSGERRFHAALEVGLNEVPCIELNVSDQQALEIALIENLQRRDLSAFEEAEGFRTLIDKYQYTHEEVSEAVGRSRVTVTETLKLLELPKEIRATCRQVDINAKGLLLEIAKAGDPAIMHQLIEEIASGEIIDRSSLRRRRKQLVDGEATDGPRGVPSPEDSDSESGGEKPRKPFIFRFSAPDERVKISLSFKSEAEPSPDEVVAALEDLIQQIRAEQAQE